MSEKKAIGSKGSTSKIVNSIITLALMFGFGFLPPFGGITPVGMRLFGIFLGVVYGYSTCEVIWPSFMAIIAYGLSGYTDIYSGIASMLGHPVVFTVLASFLSAGALNHYGFSKWFIRWSLSRKVFNGRPFLYVWSFIVIFGLSALIIDLIPLSVLLYTIWLDLAKGCGYDKDTPFVYVGFGGILLGTILGNALIPFCSWPLGLAMNWAAITGSPMNYGLIALITVPASIIILTLYLVITKHIFKIDYSRLQKFDLDKLGEESKVMRPRTKRILFFYVTSVLIIILGNTFLNTGFATFVNDVIGSVGIYGLCAGILMLLPSGEGDGQPCIVFDDIKESAISWPVLLMCAVTLPISSAVTSDVTGIVPFLSNLFAPLLGGHGAIFILIVTIVLALVLTNVGSNIAFGSALIPIIAPFILATGANPLCAGVAIIYIVNIGMVLPGASAPAAIFHAQDAIPNGSMRIKVTLIGCLCVLAVCIPYFSLWSLLLG